jgi:hypothetical protein
LGPLRIRRSDYPGGRTVFACDYFRQASTQLADKQVQTNNFSKTTRITGVTFSKNPIHLLD